MAILLVTGASRGIGLELARLALEAGFDVVATARRPESSTGLVALAHAAGSRLAVLPLDVTSDASVAAARRMFGDGPLDVLVNNAGIIGPAQQSTLDTDFAGFAETLETNTIAPLRVTQAFLPNLTLAKGKIVTITSGMGSIGRSGSDRIAYRASKAAVNMVMNRLAADVRGRGVAVQLLHPGWVRTDMGGASASLSVEERARGILRRISDLTLDRTGTFVDHAGTPFPW